MPDKITGPISAARTLESLHNYLSRGYLAVSFRTGIGIATYQGDEEIFSRGKKMLKAEEINVNDGHASDYLRKGIADICSALVRNGNGRSAERDIAPLNHACTFDLHRIAMNCVPLSSQFAASPVGRKIRLRPAFASCPPIKAKDMQTRRQVVSSIGRGK